VSESLALNVSTLADYIRTVPKVELHVHLEGSMPPELLLELARKHAIALPYDTVKGLREWYRFVDFPHFVEIYVAMSACLRTPDDIEALAWAFMRGQAAQNVLYSEVTYTLQTHSKQKGLSYADQHVALNRARRRAERELGVSMRMIYDIAREVSPEDGLDVARWVCDAYHTPDSGIAALGLGGYEVGHPPEKFAESFALARERGVPLVLHAGETAGPESIHSALMLGAVRIGHGVRCLEDVALTQALIATQTPLEVCPSSNVRLGVFPSLTDHPIQRMIDAGLYVTLNSDDPPMFDTTLTDEYLRCAETFAWTAETIDALIANAARAALLPDAWRDALVRKVGKVEP